MNEQIQETKSQRLEREKAELFQKVGYCEELNNLENEKVFRLNSLLLMREQNKSLETIHQSLESLKETLRNGINALGSILSEHEQEEEKPVEKAKTITVPVAIVEKKPKVELNPKKLLNDDDDDDEEEILDDEEEILDDEEDEDDDK